MNKLLTTKDEWLTSKDLIEKYKITNATVHNWMNSGMPSHLIARRSRRFNAKEVEEWLFRERK